MATLLTFRLEWTQNGQSHSIYSQNLETLMKLAITIPYHIDFGLGAIKRGSK